MLQTFLSDGRMREFLTQARTIAVVEDLCIMVEHKRLLGN